MKNKTLITTYTNPDIDGIASCFTYSKILKSHGVENDVLFWGKPQPEVDFIIQKFGLNIPYFDGNKDWDNVIVLDTSSSKRLAKEIEVDKVLEIVDHHPSEDGKEFVNAKIQNEEVGATATLIVEKLQIENLKISNDLAILLFMAIYQNTLNMLVGVTDRDKNAVSFLISNYEIDQKLIEEMFNYVVSYTLANLKTVLESDFKEFEVESRKCIGGQVLFYDAKPHLPKLIEVVNEIEVLKTVPFFVKADDLKFNKTYFYCPDNWLQEIVKKKLNLTFNNNWSELTPIILRKKVIKALT